MSGRQSHSPKVHHSRNSSSTEDFEPETLPIEPGVLYYSPQIILEALPRGAKTLLNLAFLLAERLHGSMKTNGLNASFSCFLNFQTSLFDV